MEVNQTTQEQRIAERRQRLQKRMQAQGRRRSSHAGGAADGEDAQAVAGDVSAAERRARTAQTTMARARSEVLNAVTQFPAKADTDEAERRDREGLAADARAARLGAASREAAAKGGAVGLGFEALYEHRVPHDLRDALAEQEAQCEEILRARESVIEELSAQLEAKEEDYVRLLRQQARDVNELVDAMTAKTDEFVDQYARQLDEVEAEYERERREFIEQCDSEINALIKTRRTKETDYRKRREAKIAEAQTRLEERHEVGYEDYNDTKRGHQEGISTLQQELEKCKADFLLNGERLSYNLQVLRERVKENRNAQNQYKRKLAKLQNTLSTLVARHQESDTRFQRTNKALTTQLHRVVGQYKDAQEKFQLFEKADKDKYRQLWNMHDQRCQRLVHRSLQADRVVFEEVLRVPWSPPDLSFWPDDPAQADAEVLREEEEVDDQEEAENAIELSEPAMMLLQILRDQAPFLVHPRVHDAIRKIEGTTEEQANVEGILTTLRIKRNQDVADLLEYFMVDGEDDTTVALIDPQEALRALNAFLEDRKTADEATAAKSATAASAATGSSGGTAGLATAAKKRQQKEKARQQREQRRAAQEKAYWSRLSQCVPKEHLHTWEALENGLEQYLAQLQHRRDLISQTDALRTQNEELKGLLAEYMRSSVNNQLYVPPTLVTSMRNR